MTGIFAGLALVFAAAGGWIVAAGIGLAAVAALLVAPRPTLRLVPAVVVVAAALLGAARAVPRPDAAPLPWADGVEAVRGTVTAAPVRSGLSQRFVVRVAEAEVEKRWLSADALLCVVAQPEPVVGDGDRLWLAGGATRIDDVETRFRPVMRSRGCGASMYARSVAIDERGLGWRRAMAEARDGLSGVLERLAPGDIEALMSGLVTGDDDALSPDTQDAFVETGTTHITAVSGSNFTTLLVAFVAAGRATGWRRRLPWLLLVVVAVWAYAAFVGLNPPATRAALVATGASLALLVGRRPEIVTLIVVAAGLMIAINPAQVWSLSFQLSLAASLAIAAVAAVPEAGGARAWLAAAILATLVAQVATLPILLPISGGVSAMSLPANLAIGPLVALAFPLSATAGLLGAVWPPLGATIAVPARLTCEAIVGIVAWSAARGGTVGIGDLPPRSLLVVSLLVAGACLAASRDGQRTWRRWPRLWAGMGERERWLWGAGLMGSIATLMMGLVV
jgi:competence protein ComEC